MRDGHQSDAGPKAWILSPAIATAAFFALKLALGPGADAIRTDAVLGAGAETPSATPVQVRVVSEIRRAGDPARQARTVPDNEADLMKLLEQDGSVTFLSDEVEVVTTSEQNFAQDEALEITVPNSLRSARFAR